MTMTRTSSTRTFSTRITPSPPPRASAASGKAREVLTRLIEASVSSRGGDDAIRRESARQTLRSRSTSRTRAWWARGGRRAVRPRRRLRGRARDAHRPAGGGGRGADAEHRREQSDSDDSDRDFVGSLRTRGRHRARRSTRVDGRRREACDFAYAREAAPLGRSTVGGAIGGGASLLGTASAQPLDWTRGLDEQIEERRVRCASAVARLKAEEAEELAMNGDGKRTDERTEPSD